MNYNKILS